MRPVQSSFQAREERLGNRLAWTAIALSNRVALFGLLCIGFPAFAQDNLGLINLLASPFPTNRITLAIAPLANATADPALDHWRFAAASVIVPSLDAVKALRILPRSSLRYGLAQLQKKSGDSLSAEEARRLGEILEARRVLWGSFRREQGKWQVTVRIMNISDAAPSQELTASAADWFDLRDDLVSKILKELAVKPAKDERGKMMDRWTKSAATLEWLARARAESDEQHPAATWAGYVQQALKADPRCAQALVASAANQGTQGKLEPATEAARRAIKLKPDLAMAHSVLGHLFMVSERTDEAAGPLEKAALLDPDNPQVLGRLAERFMILKDVPQAVVFFAKAIQLAPLQASLHANLGRAYLFQGDRDAGLRELQEAEPLTFEPDLNTEEFLAWGYGQLNDAPAAIRHYEQALAIAARIGLNPKRVETLTHEMDQLKASTTPVPVAARPPKEYSPQALAEAFREKLNPEEQASVIQPLALTPEMTARAREITRGATNDLHKAKLLFAVLADHLDVGQHELRTAPQVFAAWNSSAAAFSCQEYALLFTSMARACGVQTYLVSVIEAWDGDRVSHACAIVFDGEKALLVDPSYRWFGVPHKKFQVLDDLEATADYLCQLSDLQLRRIATKLDPRSAYAQFKLASKLAVEEQWDEAQQQLPALQRLDTEGAMANCLQAMLALHDQRFDETVEYVRKALDHGWPVHDGLIYVIQGGAYQQQGRLTEAREAFRNALRRSPDDKSANRARRAIAKINETLGTE